MTTRMHRLQISLPKKQVHFLRARAQREGVSAAEIIRRLLEREEQASTVTQADIDAALSFAGIGADDRPLIDGKAVSEYPDLYLAEVYADRHGVDRPSRRTAPSHKTRRKKA